MAGGRLFDYNKRQGRESFPIRVTTVLPPPRTLWKVRPHTAKAFLKSFANILQNTSRVTRVRVH